MLVQLPTLTTTHCNYLHKEGREAANPVVKAFGSDFAEGVSDKLPDVTW